ncbi:uncharacterized protein LOC133844488 [Drosophila sulfurigaster albostrigata]|uniref:uncharacterized protein LOC133844488 n=1 Tax=Drosophila sulfurigaster albostrigata TaxID=89887 RepID=UPI002D218628|nr:uncharacterized protein LOC133844488 [Drosophila sulfurigaster albostrigata]
MAGNWELCLILVGFIYSTSPLVYELIRPTWDEGCVGFEKNLKVGEFEKDPSVCGILLCMDIEGRGFIYFCQQPAAFQQCDNDTVSLIANYPDCCWQCTEAVECEEEDEDEDVATEVATEAATEAATY